MQGQRHQIDLEDPSVSQSQDERATIVRDVKERDLSDLAPIAPEYSASFNGFPSHSQKRLSKFKQRTANAQPKLDNQPKARGNYEERDLVSREKDAIDRENKQRLEAMDEGELQREQQELRSSLSPTLINLLTKRPSRRDQDYACISKSDKQTLLGQGVPTETEWPMSSTELGIKQDLSLRDGTDGQDTQRSEGSLRNVKSSVDEAHISGVHFPKPPQPSELDLNDPDFNQKLQSIYFPGLPKDPMSLSWMQPISDEERGEYSPASGLFAVASLRFDFKGRLLAPRTSAQIPTTKGLHHHGKAPDSAGYTIAELAHLAQSVVPGQKCIAYQSLGRILYRLGRGEYGKEGDDLYEGLWEAVEESKMLDHMIHVAARQNEGNRSVWAYATDAVHLWRKGGGKRWQGR